MKHPVWLLVSLYGTQHRLHNKLYHTNRGTSHEPWVLIIIQQDVFPLLLRFFWLPYKQLHYPNAYGAHFGIGLDSPENPQLLAALDTLVEPVLLMPDYSGERLCFLDKGVRQEHLSGVENDIISKFLIAPLSPRALSRCTERLFQMLRGEESQCSCWHQIPQAHDCDIKVLRSILLSYLVPPNMFPKENEVQ